MTRPYREAPKRNFISDDEARRANKSISIDADVPLPAGFACPEGYGHRMKIKWPFAELLIGESFFIEQPVVTVRNAAHHWKMRWDDTQKVRFALVKEGTGTRCWRIQ